MAPSVSGRLPVPPADLNDRELPIRLVNRPLFRIHKTQQACFFFGKNATQRFDDPLRQYGVLYVASEPDAAFAEVFLRRLGSMLVSEADLRTRSITEITASKLRCVDLSANGLRKLSCDNRISTEKPYKTTGQWSRALFTHPNQPDGVIYRSRHNPLFRCVALFDRCEPRLSLGASRLLLSGVRRAWTIAQISKYDLSIIPAP